MSTFESASDAGSPEHFELTDQLSTHATGLGLTCDQAARLLLDADANEQLRIADNLQIIAEQGKIEQKLDLRLVPYAASLVISYTTDARPFEGGRNADRFTIEHEINVIRGLRHFTRRRAASRELHTGRFLGLNWKGYKNLPIAEENTPVELGGVLFGAETRTTPFITAGDRLLNNQGHPSLLNYQWGKAINSRYIDINKVTAAQLYYGDHSPMVVFGRPFNISAT